MALADSELLRSNFLGKMIQQIPFGFQFVLKL